MSCPCASARVVSGGGSEKNYNHVPFEKRAFGRARRRSARYRLQQKHVGNSGNSGLLDHTYTRVVEAELHTSHVGWRTLPAHPLVYGGSGHTRLAPAVDSRSGELCRCRVRLGSGTVPRGLRSARPKPVPSCRLGARGSVSAPLPIPPQSVDRTGGRSLPVWSRVPWSDCVHTTSTPRMKTASSTE